MLGVRLGGLSPSAARRSRRRPSCDAAQGGTPRNRVVWVGLEGDRILVCAGEAALKAQDTARNVAVACRSPISPIPIGSRPCSDGAIIDPISHKCTGQPFPMRGPGRVCVVIEAVHAGGATLGFEHAPGA